MTQPTHSTQQATVSTELYFDFLCPYAWRGVELAAVLKEGGEAFTLRHYSLVEGNHAENAKELTWRVTEQPLDEGSAYQQGSLRAFLASHAAALQGEAAHWAFTLALFRAHHERKEPLTDDTIQAAAQEAGLDLNAFTQALTEEATRRAELRAELDAAREVGVFGTPTYVLPTGEAAYYRFETLTREPAQAREWWTLYRTVLTSEAGIGTIKRAKNRPPRRA
ncbi:DsbA family oxidoreductase [Deinococcus actinosclerus]|uniref:Disulfide bond formation protein DsbA n=1 Tax=Deinococcus actinosclerus TaxID=1768108 RepID=A0ABM5X1E6_9DEIO|nr:DsbA family protein [Deinococcus actinosclerus]ALW87524.1 disulfide bond formation protein DsbA [Deinococcus actinosclerus]